MKTSNPKLYCIAICVGVVISSMLGCQDSRPDGMPELYPVTLEFIQAGAPLTDASVRLVPVDPSNTWLSGGNTDSSGRARLVTHGTYQGVPGGRYKVCVVKMEAFGEADLPDLANLGAQSTTSTPTAFSLVGLEYGAPEKTPLELEVPAQGNRYEPFDLGEAVRAAVEGPKY